MHHTWEPTTAVEVPCSFQSSSCHGWECSVHAVSVATTSSYASITKDTSTSPAASVGRSLVTRMRSG